MPRYRTRPVNGYFQKVMDDRGWSTMKDVALASGLTVDEVSRVADQKRNPFLLAHMRAAKALGISLDEWITGLMSEADDEDE